MNDYLHPDAPYPWLTPEIERKAFSYGVPLGSAVWPGLVRYVEYGTNCGSFLEALLSNDLKGAFALADELNTRAMKAWVMVLFNLMPGNSQGSRQAVADWRQFIADSAADLAEIASRESGDKG